MTSQVNDVGARRRRARRRERCGAPFKILRQSGDTTAHQYRCGDRYTCEECQTGYRRKAYACIKRVLRKVLGDSNGGDARMVTLTHATAPTRTQSIERIKEHWKGATTAVRWHCRASRKLDEWRAKPASHPQRERWLRHWREKLAEARNLQPARGRRGEPLEDERPGALPRASHWCERTGWPQMDSLDFIKVIELKKGQNGYHAHLHVLVSSQAQAEILNAAWQNTRHPFQPKIYDSTHYCQTKITGCRGAAQSSEHDNSDAAAYVTKYVTKALASAAHRGVRWLDAGGEFRPLGLRNDPCDDPPVLVFVGRISSDPAEFFACRGWAWNRLADRQPSARGKPPPAGSA